MRRLRGVRAARRNPEQSEGPHTICGSRTCKPNSVRNTNAAGRSFLWARHYCMAQATYPEVVTRRAGTSPPILARAPNISTPARMGGVPPYLVLLRVGFALPAALLRQRCALTAPFHPYPAHSRKSLGDCRALARMGGAVCFLWHFPSARLESGVPDVIRHTALRSSDFPPRPDGRSGRPVRLPTG